ncbi:MAG TPA: 4-hydroxythreonine-4-phosphate dehydrogenase PdxA [Haliangiales bacterium]|nr:4-hydroxythreonine-4-phosphate dehydrogenase PdxA [Haliangiales bacterium]
MRIGITLGDPSGIGPEIVAAALAARPDLAASAVVFGDPALSDAPGLRAITRLAPDDRIPGRPTLAGGAAQVAYLEAAIAAARAGQIDALVTAPISKTQAQAAGLVFPGHTELLAARLGAPEHAMMFHGPRLKVVLATIHAPLADVPRLVTPEAVARAAFLGAQAMARDFGVPRPRVGVLGLNPHAGEGGLFGREERDAIVPGIAAARDRLAGAGLDATLHGPLVPDAAYRGDYDLYVAMYHDQGLIPVKLLDFEAAVNVTLGLPLPRTSPDHGVAYDIAGTGRARPESFAAALALAADIVRRRIG